MTEHNIHNNSYTQRDAEVSELRRIRREIESLIDYHEQVVLAQQYPGMPSLSRVYRVDVIEDLKAILNGELNAED